MTGHINARPVQFQRDAAMMMTSGMTGRVLFSALRMVRLVDLVNCTDMGRAMLAGMNDGGDDKDAEKQRQHDQQWRQTATHGGLRSSME